MKLIRSGLLVFVAGVVATTAYTQTPKQDASREQLIAASQAGASPLFFDPAAGNTPVIQPAAFDNAKECTIRNGLPNFFHKAQTGKSVTIAYIGGSITQAVHGYRTSSARFIQSMYPSVKMKAINAGVSGTGTDLGACRLQEQVLQFHPDLVFIEFAVNGAYKEGMEGMIRQIRKQDPTIDICLIYTIHGTHTNTYVSGKIPENIQGLETLADHYKLPSIHMGLHPALLEQEGKLIWKTNSKTVEGKIVFSNDGIHPLQEGGDLYAGAIARSMLSMKKNATPQKHTLPVALLGNAWETARMYAPQQLATFSKEWEKIHTKDTAYLRQFAGWFPYLMKAEQPGAFFTFKFNGSMFGLFDIGGPEVAQLEIELDGKPVKLGPLVPGTRISEVVDGDGKSLLDRFGPFCNNRYRGQFECIQVKPGLHTVTMKISAEKADKRSILGEKQLADITANPARYNRTVVYLGKILLCGTPVR
jgi:lysophospholipase L1-like esterase